MVDCCWGGGVLALGALWLFLTVGRETVLSLTAGMIEQPTRYQSGDLLVFSRYGNMLREAGIAFGIAAICLALLVAWFRKLLPEKILLPLLLLLLLADLWRVNDRFFVLANPPQVDKKAAKSEVVQYLENRIGHYRMQPLDEESPFYYADYKMGNLSAYVTVSEKRYREFMDSFSLMSAMPDIMNLKYLVMPAAAFEEQKTGLSGKFEPVFTSSTGSVVLENRTVLPKAWLVPSVVVMEDPQQRLGIMSSSPNFNPSMVGLVESPSPLPMAQFGQVKNAGTATVDKYEPNRIVVRAAAEQNSLLVLGEKYYSWWYAYVDGKKSEIYPVNHILRGVYLAPGNHTVEFVFDPLPFKVGKYLTLASFAFFAFIMWREWRTGKRGAKSDG